MLVNLGEVFQRERNMNSNHPPAPAFSQSRNWEGDRGQVLGSNCNPDQVLGTVEPDIVYGGGLDSRGSAR